MYSKMNEISKSALDTHEQGIVDLVHHYFDGCNNQMVGKRDREVVRIFNEQKRISKMPQDTL